MVLVLLHGSVHYLQVFDAWFWYQYMGVFVIYKYLMHGFGIITCASFTNHEVLIFPCIFSMYLFMILISM